MEIYRASERGNYIPPNCPSCGVPVRVNWVYIGTSWNPDLWTPGRWDCPTSDCRGGAPDPDTP